MLSSTQRHECEIFKAVLLKFASFSPGSNAAAATYDNVLVLHFWFSKTINLANINSRSGGCRQNRGFYETTQINDKIILLELRDSYEVQAIVRFQRGLE